MKKTSLIALAALAITSLLGVTACASNSSPSSVDTKDASGQVTVRLWDENAAKAYRTSFAAFNEKNPEISVNVETVPWSDYFSNLRQDVSAGNGPDIFWLNGANVSAYSGSSQIQNINEVLGSGASDAFDPAVVEQYSSDGKLWGVPQVSDGGIAVFTNRALLEKAGVSEESLKGLKWSPNPADDTLLPVLQKLTIDEAGRNAADPAFDATRVAQYGYNASQDLQAIILEYIASNGGTYQNGDEFTYTNPKTVEAFQYIVDLINRYHVAPPAEDTNGSGDRARELFLQGKIALFQSGTYSLASVKAGAGFSWGIAPLPAGPEGAKTVAPGVVASANAQTANPAATKKVLEWMASAEGNA